MGGGASTGVIEGIRPDWVDVFRAMKLQNSEIKKLNSIYNSVDADRSGSIEVVELLTLLDIERTPFNERIFSAFDKDRTGQIDLYEFVVSLWKFCTLADGAISVFAFDIYDSDADGLLTSDQVKKMFRELFGAKGMEHETAKAGQADLLRTGTDGLVGIHAFRPYCKTHQALLTPVFTMQQKLRDATLGSGTWTSISNRNIEVHVGRSMPIKDLMILHSDRKLFHSLLEDQTILRVSSMMRIVLDNTDNAQHCVSPLPEVKQRNTYIIKPEAMLHGNVDNQNGNTHSINNNRLNTHTNAANSSHDKHETSGRSVSVHSTHSNHSVHSTHNSVHTAAVLNAAHHKHHHAVHDPHVLDVTHEYNEHSGVHAHSNTHSAAHSAHNSGVHSVHNSGEHAYPTAHSSHNNSHSTMDHHIHHHNHHHPEHHHHGEHHHHPESSVHSINSLSVHINNHSASMHSVKHSTKAHTHTSPHSASIHSNKHAVHVPHGSGSARIGSPQHLHGQRSAARSTAPVVA